MGLGESLRKAMDKIQGAGAVDEKTVKEAIKEMQRALIAANVEVNTVLALSKEIEKKAFGEIKGNLSRREFIVKVVYDELVKMMGGKETPTEPKKILLVGLFGVGKCVDGKSKITLGDGRIEEIEQLFNKYSARKKKARDGYKINLNGELIALSMNPKTLKIENKKIEAIWKLKKRNNLIQVKVDKGNNQSVKVTPEHPFFVLDDGEVKQIRADQLKKENYIALPYKTPEIINKNISIINKLIQLNMLVEINPATKNKLMKDKKK